MIACPLNPAVTVAKAARCFRTNVFLAQGRDSRIDTGQLPGMLYHGVQVLQMFLLFGPCLSELLKNIIESLTQFFETPTQFLI